MGFCMAVTWFDNIVWARNSNFTISGDEYFLWLSNEMKTSGNRLTIHIYSGSGHWMLWGTNFPLNCRGFSKIKNSNRSKSFYLRKTTQYTARLHFQPKEFRVWDSLSSMKFQSPFGTTSNISALGRLQTCGRIPSYLPSLSDRSNNECSCSVVFVKSTKILRLIRITSLKHIL